VAGDDEGVEVDHAEVVLEEGDGDLAGDAWGEWGDGCEDGAFRHCWGRMRGMCRCDDEDGGVGLGAWIWEVGIERE